MTATLMPPNGQLQMNLTVDEQAELHQCEEIIQHGKQVFYDTSLSASGKQSCASCHDPAHSFGPSNDLSVQKGGPHLSLQGYRPPPSLMYLYRQPNFSIGPDAGDADAPPDLVTQLREQGITVSFG